MAIARPHAHPPTRAMIDPPKRARATLCQRQNSKFLKVIDSPKGHAGEETCSKRGTCPSTSRSRPYGLAATARLPCGCLRLTVPPFSRPACARGELTRRRRGSPSPCVLMQCDQRSMYFDSGAAPGAPRTTSLPGISFPCQQGGVCGFLPPNMTRPLPLLPSCVSSTMK